MPLLEYQRHPKQRNHPNRCCIQEFRPAGPVLDKLREDLTGGTMGAADSAIVVVFSYSGVAGRAHLQQSSLAFVLCFREIAKFC